jgi:hypothetical protein
MEMFVPFLFLGSLFSFCGLNNDWLGWKSITNIFWIVWLWSKGRHISVGIATRYGLGGPRIEFRWGRNFPHPSRPALGPTQPLTRTVGTGPFPGVKQPGRGIHHPPLSSSEIKESRAIYLHPLWVLVAAVAQLVEALRYKLGGRGFDSRWCHWNFSLT